MTPVEELPPDPPFGRPYAYASYGDVQAHLSFVATWTATSRPNATQVHLQILNASDELDAALSVADYSVPIPTTATAAIDIVRVWTGVGAAAQTAMSMPQGSSGKHAESLEKRWTALLKSIEDGKRQLPTGKDPKRSRPRYAGRASSSFPIGPDDR